MELEYLLLEASPDKFSPWYASRTKRISLDFIDKHFDKFSWYPDSIVNRPDLTVDFVLRHINVFWVHIYHILRHANISIQDKLRLMEKIKLDPSPSILPNEWCHEATWNRILLSSWIDVETIDKYKKNIGTGILYSDLYRIAINIPEMVEYLKVIDSQLIRDILRNPNITDEQARHYTSMIKTPLKFGLNARNLSPEFIAKIKPRVDYFYRLHENPFMTLEFYIRVFGNRDHHQLLQNPAIRPLELCIHPDFEYDILHAIDNLSVPREFIVVNVWSKHGYMYSCELSIFCV